jgi:hypothetical protein
VENKKARAKKRPAEAVDQITIEVFLLDNY